MRRRGQTDGLVDPTLGLSLAALGYDADLDAVRAGAGPTRPPSPLPAVPEPGARSRSTRRRRLVPFGVALDLGATGKAFAADLLAAPDRREVGTD